jgi:hypothetical protein
MDSKKKSKEGLIIGTDSDAFFHEEIFDEEFEEKMNKKISEIIRKHRGLPELEGSKKE